MQLAEAVHDALAVRGLSEGALGILHRDGRHARIADAFQGISGWSAHLANSTLKWSSLPQTKEIYAV